jgi:hypothetical protein
MQKISLYILAIVAMFVTNSCKKGEVVSDPSSLGTGSYITLVKSNNTIIDFSNLATSKVSITVKEFGSPVDKIKVFVSKFALELKEINYFLPPRAETAFLAGAAVVIIARLAYTPSDISSEITI